LHGLPEHFPPLSFFGVFDGHLGKTASIYCQLHLCHNFMKELESNPTDISVCEIEVERFMFT
jgi:hypothetical protein